MAEEEPTAPASTGTLHLPGKAASAPPQAPSQAEAPSLPPIPEQGELPPAVKPRIIAAPKLRQVYWCDFWRDARLPEMWKTRPVIIMSFKNKLHGPCLVIPISTKPQENNEWAYALSESLEGVTDNWAICNQPSTIAPSRLSQFKG